MSKLLIASADSAAELAAAGRSKDDMSRTARRVAEREERKAANDGMKAVTRNQLPRVLVQMLDQTVGPELMRLTETIGSVGVELTAIVAILGKKGILTQDEVDAERATIEATMQTMHEAAVALVKEQQAKLAAETPINPQSPAFQEATKQAAGAEVHRLNEGSTIILAQR